MSDTTCAGFVAFGACLWLGRLMIHIKVVMLRIRPAA